MGKREIDVAIIGGGAAGLSAAAAAAAAGAATVLFDERPVDPPRRDAVRDGLRNQAIAAGVELHSGTLVWGIFAANVLGVVNADGGEEITASQIVLATGSIEASAPGTDVTEQPRRPDIRLALMAECAFGFSSALGGFVPGRDGALVTSVPGILVAGDCAGLCTADVAAAEGRLAGISAAVGLGMGSNAALKAAKADLKNAAAERVAEVDGLRAWYVQGGQVGPSDAGWIHDPERVGSPVIEDEPDICPCEGVDAGTIDAAIQAGARSVNDVKRRTRAGMGICQGVRCGHLVAAMIAQATGIPESAIVPMTSRPPVRPIRLGDMAGEQR